jgi:hypothetical protein
MSLISKAFAPDRIFGAARGSHPPFFVEEEEAGAEGKGSSERRNF